MGLLVDGVWQDEQHIARTPGGRFVRPTTRFRNWVTQDGSPGPTGEGGFAAARGRYHLYVALPCPWAHRTVIMRMLKGLEDVVSMSVLEPLYGPHGWRFGTSPGTSPDSVNGASELAEIYLRADPRYTGRVSVPALWDKERRTIVNNESAEIIRMLNGAFGRFTNVRTDYYPPALREEIDRVNALVYENVNNGVYRAGFATAQEAYEEAFRAVFGALDELERRLARQRYLAGKDITEADWRLFTTLVRFDAVYYSHFKCNLRRIIDYPNLSNYLRDLYQQGGVAATVNMDHIKRHYYGSQRHVNPTASCRWVRCSISWRRTTAAGSRMRPFRPIAPSIDGRARDYRSAEEISAPRAFLRRNRPISACRAGQDRLIEKLCT
jgi:putative glutathione S-transferase